MRCLTLSDAVSDTLILCDTIRVPQSGGLLDQDVLTPIDNALAKSGCLTPWYLTPWYYATQLSVSETNNT